MNYTKSQVIDHVKTLVGGSVDYDGWYGAQCVDLIGHIMQKFCGFTPWGDAIDYMSNAMPPGATRHKGSSGILPGDIPIWKFGHSDPYGHIGFCTAVESNSTTCVEQNVDGAPVGVGGPARIRTRNFDYLVGYIRLPYKAEPVSDAKVAEHNWTRVPEKGTFTSTINDKIYIRRGVPSRSADYAKGSDGQPVWYSKGESLGYDSYVINEGYVWISYIGGSGQRNYIATGEWAGGRRNGPAWGIFK